MCHWTFSSFLDKGGSPLAHRTWNGVSAKNTGKSNSGICANSKTENTHNRRSYMTGEGKCGTTLLVLVNVIT